jgi:hypothetical protein
MRIRAAEPGDRAEPDDRLVGVLTYRAHAAR